uniref:Ionotropic glutamate receptor C-terminal domain-containing protein n=1 Tax=Stomoxys calcitrans TaxID=35570 RepID=A0A1I8PB12_STOCA
MKLLFHIIVYTIIIRALYANVEKQILNIGAIFFKDETDLEAAFDTAVQDINYLNQEYQLEFNPIKHYLSEDDSVILQEIACDLLQNSVAAIIGPSSATKSVHGKSKIKSMISFFLTNLDTHTSGIDKLLSDIFLSNVTSVRLRSYIPPPVHSETDVFDPGEKDSVQTLNQQNIYDALVLLYNALQQTFQPDPIPVPEVSCEGGFWEPGNDLIDKMKKLDQKHLEPHYKTQKLTVNSFGIRDDFNLEIYDVMVDDTLNVWNKQHGLVVYDNLISNFTRKVFKPKKKGDHVDYQKKKIKYTVATRIGEPYFMIREEPEGVHFEGNDRFKGYVVDLLFELAKNLHFDFVFEPVPDNKYGAYDPNTNEWDGIVRQLMDNQAQMGICDLTITQERRTVVDFTVPFMQLGVQILYSKPPPPKKELFQFLEPFSVAVWLCLLIALFLMSLVYVVLARFTPDEWKTQKDPNTVELTWTLRNSFYLHINSILQVGCDILPTAGPMRLFTTFWWIFALLMAQTYLAKMTSFITASKMDGTIQNLHDLVQQDKIQFGTVKGGSTSLFFSQSSETDYRLAWNKMKSFKPEALTKDNKEGVDRVKHSKGRYAYLLETPILQYYAKKNCDLMPIGDPFGEKFYGIAVPLNAPYRSELNVGILKLSEQGFLYKLKREWIFHNNTVLCEDAPSTDGTQMDMQTLRGVFLVLQLGIGVGIIIGIAEFFWYINKMAVREKISPKLALARDFKFFLNFWKQIKPLSIYKCPEAGSQSRGSLMPSTATETNSSEKHKRKVKRRKKPEKDAKV